MDGGNVTAPSFGFFNPEGEWDVENHGVQPDVEVEMDPKAVRDGHDPQLEKAVALALKELAEHPIPEPHRPAYPELSPGGAIEDFFQGSVCVEPFRVEQLGSAETLDSLPA